jgi:hypothetical protein
MKENYPKEAQSPVDLAFNLLYRPIVQKSLKQVSGWISIIFLASYLSIMTAKIQPQHWFTEVTVELKRRIPDQLLYVDRCSVTVIPHPSQLVIEFLAGKNLFATASNPR